MFGGKNEAVTSCQPGPLTPADVFIIIASGEALQSQVLPPVCLFVRNTEGILEVVNYYL